MIKIYLSGAITHNQNYIKDFTKAKQVLEEKGFCVLSPIETEAHSSGLPAKFCMMAALDLLKEADIITVITEGIPSKGVKIEADLASYYGIPFVEYKNLTKGENK